AGSPFPGAKLGRGGVVMPFQGHIVSPTRRPSIFCPVYVFGSPASVRLLSHCQSAQRRSTFECNMKKSGSFGAVGMLEIEPLNDTCAAPWGVPSIVRN